MDTTIKVCSCCNAISSPNATAQIIILVGTRCVWSCTRLGRCTFPDMSSHGVDVRAQHHIGRLYGLRSQIMEQLGCSAPAVPDGSLQTLSYSCTYYHARKCPGIMQLPSTVSNLDKMIRFQHQAERLGMRRPWPGSPFMVSPRGEGHGSHSPRRPEGEPSMASETRWRGVSPADLMHHTSCSLGRVRSALSPALYCSGLSCQITLFRNIRDVHNSSWEGTSFRSFSSVPLKLRL